MTVIGPNERSLVDALDEPALVIEAGIVRLANAPARKLLGAGIEGRDVRLAIRHPQALEVILGKTSGEVDATGIVEPGRSWRLIVRRLWPSATLVRIRISPSYRIRLPVCEEVADILARCARPGVPFPG